MEKQKNMKSQDIANSLNLKRQCRSYGLPLWQCPQFLFLVMGVFIIVTSVFYYLVGSYFSNDLIIIALGDLVITAILFVISFIITRNFEKLAEISRMKSEFVNIVTHQLRSPLTNLKWTVDFLTSKDFDENPEKKEEYYGNLKENVRRMVELTDTLLFVAKMEQGLVPFSKKEVPLPEIINGFISEFKPFTEASRVKIKFVAEKNVPAAFVDPSQIKIVIETLIDNAIKYTKNGGTVEINLKKIGKKIYFEIKDEGVGIPLKDQKFIFKKFFRSENSLKNQTRGSGLGLYIAKSIIDQLKGVMEFRSEEGKGSTFYFYLPIE